MTECSIVIPTYERPGYLKRILGYYNDSHVVYNIIVADGSSDKIKQLNKETVSSFPGIKIQHLEGYSFDTPPHIRVADALTYVNTRYCVFCADDDFITPNGIKQAVDFLEKNPDFTVAHGKYVAFSLSKDEQGNQQFVWVPTYSCESIDFLNPETRLSYHLSEYSQATFYAVHRTDFLRVIWAENTRLMLDALMSELLLSMLTLIYGKLKCLDVLYAARDVGSAKPGLRRPALPDAIKAGIIDPEFASFRECLSTHLSKQSKLDLKESRNIIDKAVAAYVKKYNPVNALRRKRTKKKILFDYLHLPDWMDEVTAKVYLALFRKTAPPPLESYHDFTPPYEELRGISSCVLVHSEMTYKVSKIF